MLQVLGGGFRVVELGDRQYVASVPKELDRDANAVMHTAQVSLHTLLIMAYMLACKASCKTVPQLNRQLQVDTSQEQASEASANVCGRPHVGPRICIRGRPGGQAVMAADSHSSSSAKAAVAGVALAIRVLCLHI
jgi:EAP30/Vps36 family